MTTQRAEPAFGWWMGPVVILITLVVGLLAMEGALRLLLDANRLQALPHVAISEDLQRQLEWVSWHSRSQAHGTTSYPSAFDQFDPQLGWRVRPGVSTRHTRPGVYDVQVTTNRFGLRGEAPREIAKPAGVLRVGIFGDSQTFGETVEDRETYVSLLNRAAPGTEFLNFGVRGFGTDQMLLYHASDARAYELDVVVIGFAFYHLERNVRRFLFYAKPKFDVEQGQLVLRGTPVPAPQALLEDRADRELHPLLDRSVLLRWLWQRWRWWQADHQFAPDGEAWQLTSKLLERMVADVQAQGARAVLMNIDATHPELEPALDQLAQRLGVGLLNLGPLTRKAAAEGAGFMLPNDGHWNASGHAQVAKALQSHLCTHKITPCP